MNSSIVHILNWDNWWEKDVFFIIKRFTKKVLVFVTKSRTIFNSVLIVEKLTMCNIEV